MKSDVLNSKKNHSHVKAKCTLCTTRFVPNETTQSSSPNGNVCRGCIEDIKHHCESTHPLKQYELKLKIDLRVLRVSLQQIKYDDPHLLTLLEVIKYKLSCIEQAINNANVDCSEIEKTVSEFKTLLKLYP